MEYTKDLILSICYDKESNTLHLKKSKWTSKILKILKKNKLLVTICTIFAMFAIMDVILVTNFMRILEVCI